MKWLNLKIIGLTLLLFAWGANYFWLSNIEKVINLTAFVVTNYGIIQNRSHLQFIKYVVQGRKNPKLLTLTFIERIDGIEALNALLSKVGIVYPEKLSKEIKSLSSLVEDAYEKGLSLEPNGIGRNIDYELSEIENQLIGEHIPKLTSAIRKQFKFWNTRLTWMYICGSLLLIIGECRNNKKNLTKQST